MPGPAIRIVYEVQGPGGLEGTLEVMAKPGGHRRENWTLRRVVGEEAREVRGTTIQTPDLTWSGQDGQTGVVTAAPIGALAAAYLDLASADRARVAESLRRWHADLEQARAAHPGDVHEIAGQSCLRMRIAAQDLCLWEQTGLPLDYRGAEFRLEATHVDTSAKIAADAFALPADAEGARHVEAPDRLRLDPKNSIQSLADGDYASLSLLLTPGLRVPLPEETPEG